MAYHAVATIRNPAFAGSGYSHAQMKILMWRPVRTPVKFIEFKMHTLELISKLFVSNQRC